MTDATIRASDADRDQAAAALGEHLAAGRLTIEEFDERLDQAYAAKTLGELGNLMTDLPAIDLDQVPEASLRRSRTSLPPAQRRAPGSVQARQDGFPPAWRAAWGSWLMISLFLFVIWLASGGPWPLCIALALGAVLLGRMITGTPGSRERRSGRPRRLPDQRILPSGSWDSERSGARHTGLDAGSSTS